MCGLPVSLMCADAASIPHPLNHRILPGLFLPYGFSAGLYFCTNATAAFSIAIRVFSRDSQ